MQKKILVVNDSITTNLILCKSLENNGYSAQSVVNGKEALKMLEGKHFDLVITDLYMPEMDGIEMTKKIRANANLKYIPVIFISGAADIDKVQEAKEAGSSAWIPVPFDPQKFLTTINRFLR
jgi:two-component system chemotaxis response regulator CheY